MTRLRYTLISDGSSDQALMPILRWVVLQRLPECVVVDQWADLRRLRHPPKDLARKIAFALDLYPCELLFVHRDAEKQSAESRCAEIEAAILTQGSNVDMPVVAVVPVRMQEAWLLFDEAAIRKAAGNPNGRQAIDLPSLAHIESLPDPKALLYDLLKRCSGLHGRRLRQFPASARCLRVAGHITDFSPLRQLPAFRLLEDRFAKIVTRHGWDVRE
jgi:hypothetical protein